MMIGISPQYGVYTAAYGAIIYSFLGNAITNTTTIIIIIKSKFNNNNNYIKNV